MLDSLHKFKEAETVARELVKKRGLHFDYGVLGDALMQQGKLDDAVAAYQAMMDQKPSPQAYGRAAHIRWLKGDLPGAIELMWRAIGANNPLDPESTAWTCVHLARYEWQARDTNKALELIDEALALQPDYPPALLERGRVLLGLEKTTEAIEALKRATNMNPLPEYQWTLSEALRVADRVEEARAVEGQLTRRGAAERVYERVQNIASDLNIAPDQMAETALRFVLSHRAVSTVIPGMRSVRNVERNCQAGDGRGLPREQVEKLKAHRWIRNFYE